LEGRLKIGAAVESILQKSTAGLTDLKSAAECEAFFRMQPGGLQAIVRANHQISEFNRSYVIIGGYLHHTTRKLLSIEQEMLDTILHQYKLEIGPQMANAMMLAAESYVMRGVHDKVFLFMCRLHEVEDTALARLIGKLEACITQEALGVPPNCKCDLTEAVARIANLPAACCPVEKLNCITVSLHYEPVSPPHREAKEKLNCITVSLHTNSTLIL
jgi:hypothetical protein